MLIGNVFFDPFLFKIEFFGYAPGPRYAAKGYRGRQIQ